MARTDDNERLEAFEKMLKMVKEQYEANEADMKRLRDSGKEKTVTFKQKMAEKLTLQNILSIYRMYDLID